MIPKQSIELFYCNPGRATRLLLIQVDCTTLDQGAKRSEGGDEARLDEERTEVTMGEAFGEVLRGVKDGAIL
jgi:hypothetical protein